MANHGGRRRGAGRKPETGEPKTEYCRVPLSPAELEELQIAADGIPLARWLREAGLERARR